MAECYGISKCTVYKQKGWHKTRIVYQCGLVVRATGRAIFEASRRCDIQHGRLCDNAIEPLFGPEKGRVQEFPS